MKAIDFDGWLSCQEMEWDDETEKEYELVTKIISLQVSRYILRRTSHICQSLLDAGIQPLIVELKDEYYKTFQKEYVDPNIDVEY